LPANSLVAVVLADADAAAVLDPTTTTVVAVVERFPEPVADALWTLVMKEVTTVVLRPAVVFAAAAVVSGRAVVGEVDVVVLDQVVVAF
jgi:hypothetical protein